MLISRKLPLAAALLTIMSIGASSIVSLQIGSSAVNEKIAEKLEAVVDGRRNQLETFLANLQQDLSATSQNNLMRIALEGFKYDWGFADTKESVADGDHVEDWHTGRFVVDETSMMYVAGTKIDFVEETFGSQFEISNPNSTASCGCGESFGV